MPTCITLVGYPAVGKSTFTKKFEQEGWTVVSVDDAVNKVLAAHGLTHHDDWSAYRAEAAALVDLWLEDAIKHNKNIVFDALNTSVNRRARHKDFITQHSSDYVFEAIVIHPPEEDEHASRLVKRAFARRRSSIPGLLNAFYFADLAEKFEMPTAAEGYSKITEIGAPPHQSLMQIP